MSNPASGAEGPRDARESPLDQPEQLGGADAVEKTTYVVGEGTEPNRRRTAPSVAAAHRGGRSVGMWIVVGVAGLIGVVYALGILR